MWIFLLVKQTLIRGRSLVPVIFLRMRQRRRWASLCFCSVLIGTMNLNDLLDGLAFLTDDAFVAVADAFAFVRFRRVEAADFGSHLADSLAVGAFDGQFGVFLDGNFDLRRERVIDGVRIAEAEVDSLALNEGF